MFYRHLLTFVYCLILTQSLYSAEDPSKKEKQLSSSKEGSGFSFLRKSNHNAFSKSDAGPTSSSKTKTSPTKLPINLDVPEIKHNQYDPSQTSPKVSPTSHQKTHSRKLSVDSNRKESPKHSPRKIILTNNQDEKTEKKILSNLPELPRSRSYNPSDKQAQDNSKQTRTTKSKSTNDTPVLTKKKSLKQLNNNDNSAITTSTSSQKEETNYSKSILSISDSVVDNPTNPSQIKTPIITHNNNNNTNNTPPLTTRNVKEYSFTKRFLKSSGDSSSSISSQGSSKSNDKSNLIQMVRNKDVNSIEKCINNSNTNVNQQNELGMTALHYAALSKQLDIIKLLILQPSLDSTIKNNNEKRQNASELIDGADSCAEIRKLLFARLSLDTVVMQETFIMLMKLHINNQQFNNKNIQETREIIIKKTNTTKISQGASELPQEAQLPSYATDQFIEEMICCRIPIDLTNIELLIATIDGEIQRLRENIKKNIKFNNTEIYESVTTVQNHFTGNSSSQKKSHKKTTAVSLPYYATYEFIFNVIYSSIADDLLEYFAEQQGYSIINFNRSGEVTDDMIKDAILEIRNAMRKSGQTSEYGTDAEITALIKSNIEKQKEQKVTPTTYSSVILPQKEEKKDTKEEESTHSHLPDVSLQSVSAKTSDISLRSSIEDKK